MASIDMGAATVISSEHFMVKGMYINPLTYCAYCCSYLYHNFSICDPACENRACGHKLHSVTQHIISQYWDRICDRILENHPYGHA